MTLALIRAEPGVCSPNLFIDEDIDKLLYEWRGFIMTTVARMWDVLWWPTVKTQTASQTLGLYTTGYFDGERIDWHGQQPRGFVRTFLLRWIFGS